MRILKIQNGYREFPFFAETLAFNVQLSPLGAVTVKSDDAIEHTAGNDVELVNGGGP